MIRVNSSNTHTHTNLAEAAIAGSNRLAKIFKSSMLFDITELQSSQIIQKNNY